MISGLQRLQVSKPNSSTKNTCFTLSDPHQTAKEIRSRRLYVYQALLYKPFYKAASKNDISTHLGFLRSWTLTNSFRISCVADWNIRPTQSQPVRPQRLKMSSLPLWKLLGSNKQTFTRFKQTGCPAGTTFFWNFSVCVCEPSRKKQNLYLRSCLLFALIFYHDEKQNSMGCQGHHESGTNEDAHCSPAIWRKDAFFTYLQTPRDLLWNCPTNGK